MSFAFGWIVPAHNILASCEKAIVEISGDDENEFSQSIFINS
jgi:hypothetical protein